MVVVLIPVLDESRNIEVVVRELSATLVAAGEDFRILAVDDGSRDASGDLLRGLQGTFPLDVITFASNRGIGEVLRTGLPEACQKAGPDGTIVFLEGDGSNDAGVLPAMLGQIRAGMDIVIASRFRAGGTMEGFPVGRRILSRTLSALVGRVVSRPGISDWSIFYRAYRARLVRRALEASDGRVVKGDGFFANTELLLNLLAFAPRVGEVALPYSYYRKKSASRIRVFREVAMHIKLLATYRLGGARWTRS